MFVQVINKFENIALHCTGNSNVVDEAIFIGKGKVKSTREGSRRRTRTHLRWMTYSHNPTPPACGHTGTPNLGIQRLGYFTLFAVESESKAHLAAMNKTLKTSLTPASLHASIWTTSSASACKSCLKTMRL